MNLREKNVYMNRQRLVFWFWKKIVTDVIRPVSEEKMKKKDVATLFKAERVLIKFTGYMCIWTHTKMTFITKSETEVQLIYFPVSG